MRLIWGRQPVVFWTMVVTLLSSLSLLLGLDVDVQGYVNAFLLTFGGVLTAVTIGNRDGILPGLLGAIKAGFALVLALGVHVAGPTQVAVLTIVSAAGAFFVYGQVTAPEPGAAQADLHRVA